jgi:hypothetical protein
MNIRRNPDPLPSDDDSTMHNDNDNEYDVMSTG